MHIGRKPRRWEVEFNMTKARRIDVVADFPESTELVDIETILRREHGAHGLRILGRTVLAEPTADPQPLMFVDHEDENNGLNIRYQSAEGVVNASTRDAGFLNILSDFALNNLGIPIDEQSSRQDSNLLENYSGERPNLEADPSIWITQNPLMVELCRKYPQYGNLIRYVCNERGLFLKVGNYPVQRAYWNSATNGGLPVFRKADPIHEGTFMLHDILHFIPEDPVIGPNPIKPEHKSAYIAHRLMSESITLVLADMVAVADADLESKDYDIARRRIYPIYKSILQASGVKPDIDKLLAANVYFCFTGEGAGFEALGASEEAIVGYRSKYETIFKDDFLWNLHNFDEMLAERDGNPLILEYYQWLNRETSIPSVGMYDEIANVDEQGLDIAAMLSRFRGDFREALLYSQPLDNFMRHRKAAEKYLAGQRIVFARYGKALDSSAEIADFDKHYQAVKVAGTEADLKQASALACFSVNDYVDRLTSNGTILPHERALYRFSAPLYPIKFVNYERKKENASKHLSDEVNQFLSVNEKQLSRVLESASAA